MILSFARLVICQIHFLINDFEPSAILDCVTTQIIELYSTFQRIHPTFLPKGGTFSLIGHSLGSVIAWDILSILKDNIDKDAPKGSEDDPIKIDVLSSPIRAPSLTSLDKDVVGNSYKIYEKKAEHDGSHGTWGPTLPKKMTRTIPFAPQMTVFLGSPVGLFLTLRGAHSVFDEMRAVAEAERASLIPCDNEEAAERPPPVFNVTPIICSPFSLPTKALFNIFHPR